MTAMATLYVTHQGSRALRHLYFEILRLLYHSRLKIGKMANFLLTANILILKRDKKVPTSLSLRSIPRCLLTIFNPTYSS